MSFFAFHPPVSARAATLTALLALLSCGQMISGCDSTGPSGPPADPNVLIVIQSPAGGEKLTVGDTLRIKWTTQGKGIEDVNSVNIEITPDGGKTWLTLLNRSIGKEDEAWGNYPWKVAGAMTYLGVEHALAGRADLRVRIMQYSTTDADKRAVGGAFSIAARL